MTAFETSMMILSAGALSAALIVRFYGQKRLSLLLARLTRP